MPRFDKYIHLTDTHLVKDAGTLYGLNPKQRLLQAVEHINRHHADARGAFITGDLTHNGHDNAYAHLRECLDTLQMPVYPILGNHDSRANFQQNFPLIQRDAHGFVQYVVELEQHTAIFLDTNEPGVHWGVFCQQRAQWLRAALEKASKPVLLFMHHPFFPIGITSMDHISLRDTRPFEAAIAGLESRIAHCFFGHIHRPIFGTFRGMPYSTLRSTNHHVALVLQDQSLDIVGKNENPQYGVLLLGGTQVLLHLEDYIDSGEHFILGG
ncbi:phosphodiesterase [Cupriavidus necator]